MQIVQIECPEEKKRVVQYILESLPAWFEQSEGREQYIRESAEQICICAYDEANPCQIYVMALKENNG